MSAVWIALIAVAIGLIFMVIALYAAVSAKSRAKANDDQSQSTGAGD